MSGETATAEQPQSGTGRGRLVTGMVWALLLLGLWLWGRVATDGVPGGPALGDVSAAGRQFTGGAPLPAAHDPLDGVTRPVRLDIDTLGVHARVLRTGLDGDGAVAAPPYARADAVGWYGRGPAPGERGAALIVGHVDTDERRAVFYALSTAERGTRVEVTGADGTVGEFVVEDVDVVQRGRFDADEAYGPREKGRAELRLITCGGTFDRAEQTYTSNVVVSAYLTGTRET